MIDVTSSGGRRWRHARHKLVRLIQMITQGRWISDSKLSNLTA